MVGAARVYLYVIDVESGMVYEQTARARDIPDIAQKAFSEFLAGRGTPRYKIAIFPLQSTQLLYQKSQFLERKIVTDIKAYLKDQDGFQATFSYDSAPTGEPEITVPQVWKGPSREGLDTDAIRQLGEQLGVQAVVTAWFSLPGGSSPLPGSGHVYLYVIDVESGVVYEQNARARDTSDIAETAFSEFLAGRGTPRYKVAIFPSQTAIEWDLADREIVTRVKSYLRDAGAFEVAYSYDSVPAGEAKIPTARIWKGYTSKGLDTDAVRQLGKQLGVQAVVTTRYRYPGGSGQNVDVTQVYLYVIDVESGMVYEQTARARDIPDIAEKAFSEFLAGRGTPRYKVAIFPLRSRWPAGNPARAIVARVKSYLTGEGAFEVAYSYDSVPAGETKIPMAQIWKGVSREGLDTDAVRQLGAQLGVQAVVTAWHKQSGSWDGDWGTGHVYLYVIDVESGAVYEQDAATRQISDIAEKAFSEFLASRGE